MKEKTHENKKATSKIPATGRIGRFAKMIEQVSGRDIAEKVLQNIEQAQSSSYVKKAAWWKRAIQHLEELVGREKTIEIMEQCGRKCCGATSRKRAQALMDESHSLEEFIETLNQKGLGGGRLTLDTDTVRGGYDRCYCGQVKKTKTPFETNTYCHCSVGWYKQLFESVLKTPVDVELIQSIICGADTCEFIIHLKST